MIKKIAKITYFLLCIWFLLINSSVVYASDLFWIQEGTLEFEFEGGYAYLYNESAGARYYYELKDKLYVPLSSIRDKKVLRFKISGDSPVKVELGGYKFKKKNNLKNLVIEDRLNKTKWRIKKKNGYFIIPEKVRQVQSISKLFNDKYGLKPEKIKPNFEIKLKRNQHKWINQLIHKNSKQTELQNKLTEFIKGKIRKDLRNKMNLRSINKINMRNEPYQIFDLLYKDLNEKNSRLQENNFKNYQDKYKELLAQLEKFRQFHGKILGIKSSIKNYKNKIKLSQETIQNLNKQIKDKQVFFDAQKRVYQSNYEAHAEYGLYVFKFQLDSEKSLIQHEEEINNILKFESPAIEELGSIFIQTETTLEYNGRTGKSYFDEWTKQVSKGYISVNSTNRDSMPYASGSDYFVIKSVKYLPKISNTRSYQMKQYDSSKFNADKYEMFSVLDQEQLEKIIRKIEHLKIKREQIIVNRIKEKYNEVKSQKDYVYKIRKELFEKFCLEIDRIHQSIKAIELKIYTENKQINDDKQSINLFKYNAKGYYEKCQKTIKYINFIIEALINKIHNTFKFSISDTGNAFRQPSNSPLDIISEQIYDRLFSLVQRYELIYETIHTTLKNGIFIKNSEYFELEKLYNSLRVYCDSSPNGDNVIIYVIVSLDMEVIPTSGLLPNKFDEQKNELNKLWSEIQIVDREESQPPVKKYVPINKKYRLPSEAELNDTSSSCEHCIIIKGKEYSFKYFENLDIYDNIEFGISTPEKIADSFNEGNKKWRLPRANEINFVVEYAQSKKLDWDIRDKRIYIGSKKNKYGKFSAIYVDNKYSHKTEKIDSGDMAYIILVSE